MHVCTVILQHLRHSIMLLSDPHLPSEPYARWNTSQINLLFQQPYCSAGLQRQVCKGTEGRGSDAEKAAMPPPGSNHDNQIVIQPSCIGQGDHQRAGLIVVLKFNLLGVQDASAGRLVGEHEQPPGSMHLNLQAINQ